MADGDITDRAWVVDIIPEEVRMRCSYRRRRKRIVQYTVQLEMYYSGKWEPVVRYDNAHGFCHRDTIHADGSQEKTAVYYGDANSTFTQAIDDLRNTWQAHLARVLREFEQ